MAKAALAMKIKPLNLSGIDPLEYKVLILPKTDDGTITLRGGFKLHKPDETKERDDNASMEGEVIAMSPLAFSYEKDAPRPEAGSIVVFQRYSGINVTGADGKTYRLMNDKDVVAVRA